MFKFLRKSVKGIATGKAQANLGLQSGDLPPAITRVGRFLYTASGIWIVVTWYTVYVNKRTDPGGGPRVVIGGKVINPPDRANRNPSFTQSVPGTVTQNNQTARQSPSGFVNVGSTSGRSLVPLSPSQLGVPGSAVPGYLWSAPNKQKQFPAFDRKRYQILLAVAVKIANQYGLKITSGYRPGTGSMDLHASGLAFDMVGAMPNMRRAAKWASTNPAMFQEIFIHNEGSGMHLHLGFYPDAGGIFNAAVNSLSRPTAVR